MYVLRLSGREKKLSARLVSVCEICRPHSSGAHQKQKPAYKTNREKFISFLPSWLQSRGEIRRGGRAQVSPEMRDWRSRRRVCAVPAGRLRHPLLAEEEK
jgi:hypothetical protein